MKRYNTPHRNRVVKTRMTEEEYAEFAQRLSAYHMSQAEFIRQAITGAAIYPIITVYVIHARNVSLQSPLLPPVTYPCVSLLYPSAHCIKSVNHP